MCQLGPDFEIKNQVEAVRFVFDKRLFNDTVAEVQPCRGARDNSRQHVDVIS